VNAHTTPSATTGSAATHAATPRPTATATIAVIDPSTVAAWGNPQFNQPSATSFQATSVSNGVGSYSIPFNVTFVPTPYQNDPRFKPPVISLVFAYTDPITSKDVQVPLVSNQTTTVKFTETCPASGGTGALDGTASVYVQDANGIVWKTLNASTPQNVRNTFLHLDLTCP
jgi:hypothetical protein